jgi:hypothetical protein
MTGVQAYESGRRWVIIGTVLAGLGILTCAGIIGVTLWHF